MLSVAGNLTRKKYQTDVSERIEISFRRKEATERKSKHGQKSTEGRQKHDQAAHKDNGTEQPNFSLPSQKRKARKSRGGLPLSFRRSEIATERNRAEISFWQKREEMNSVELKGAPSERGEIFRRRTEEKRKPRLINMEKFFGTSKIPHGDEGLSECQIFLPSFWYYFFAISIYSETAFRTGFIDEKDRLYTHRPRHRTWGNYL